MTDIEEDLAEFLPVLSVVLIDRRKGGQGVLVGIRNEAVNVNHPNVVSVPTMRLPVDLARAVVEQVEHQQFTGSIRRPGVAHDPMGFALWSLLAAKLGVADAIEADLFDVKPVAGCVMQGESLIDYVNGVDVTERLTMINLLCVVDRGHEHVPTRNSVFSHMQWLDYDVLVDAATSKDLAVLDEPFTSPEVCIHGLCIKTAVALHPSWKVLSGAHAS